MEVVDKEELLEVEVEAEEDLEVEIEEAFREEVSNRIHLREKFKTFN